MATTPLLQQPTKLLLLLLALVLFGFASIVTSHFTVQRLSQKTAFRTADHHARIHIARHMETLIKDIQADFFLLPTLSNRLEQQVAQKTSRARITKALEALELLKNGGDMHPPKTIALLLDLPDNRSFVFMPENHASRLVHMSNIKDLLQQIDAELEKMGLLLLIHGTSSPAAARTYKSDALQAIMGRGKDTFEEIRQQAGDFILSSQKLLETLQQESKTTIRRYHLSGLTVAGTTFILVALLGAKLIHQIITTTRTLHSTRDNMASEYRKQKALNSLLAITNLPLSIKEKMARSLEIILQAITTQNLGEGALFLCDHSRQKIVLQAQHGLSGKLQCKDRDCSFGTCLCSIAAVSGEIIESSSDDPRHAICDEGMPAHAHYIQPITVETTTLGILLIHLAADSALAPRDKNFLGVVANTLAALIKQQLAEEKLAKNELDRLSLFESSNEAILLLQNNAIIQYNKAAALLFGLENNGKHTSLPPTRLLAGHGENSTIQTFFSLTNQAMQQGTAQSECLLQRHDNTRFEATLTFTPILFYGNQVLHVVVRDISAQKEKEQALLAAKKTAEKASRAKSNFLAAMSHEIRTPLNAILGTTKLTLNQDLQPETSENLKTIHIAATSLMLLINDTLDVTKIEEGQLFLEKAPFSLEDMVDTLKAIFAQQFRAAHLDFEVNIAPDTPRHLVGDALRISQILNNLLTNALKFTPKGTVAVTMASSLHNNDNALMRFSVQDSGIGIDEETLPIIFDEFTQAGTSRQFGGLGLGLAISKKLADLMGGRLWATSAPQQGSTFNFEVTLPVAAAQETGQERGSSTCWLPSKNKILQGARILVVEDNEINRKVIIQILQTVGARPDYAANGSEAIARLADDHQLVLMDIEMPILDGIEATRRIRAHPQFSNIPIIAMTAHAMVDDRQHCLAAGMNDYLTKPIDPGHFIHVLEKWLAPKQRPRPLATVQEKKSPAEQLPGGDKGILDMETAIEAMGGNRELYQEILADFLTLHGDTSSKIKEALDRHDKEEARALAHLLKGVASALRAHDLQSKARVMEELLRTATAEDEEVEKALGELTLSAEQLITKIQAIRAAPES